MPAIAVAAAPPMSTIVVEVYDGSKTIREIAEACCEVASDEANREAAILGWEDKIRTHTNRQFKAAVRSGRSNSSGRYSQSPSRPDDGVLGCWIRFQGTSYRYGDLTAELCAGIAAEFADRKRQNHSGEKFFKAMEAELKKSGKTAAHLGEERVLAMQAKVGFRG